MKRVGYSRKLFAQFVGFARKNRAYWIIPLLLLLAAASLLIATSSAVTPLIYAIF
ncbi:MAG: DUF5989 family protein [Myxococcota bacterium]|jgi:hypothetical protein|nr:hypothetical protein [bacterium]MDP7076170.1 DUF5989 family protein [Myxococcota bacterium]MDP7300437.1 DUF5989 family protein [Myxococcota bacterium]MDP7431561.1 DUF5989 family protein [Myxococcota bacterium]HJO24215.1 DUF5989 family protein [Myxococcota bacterium]